MADYAELIDVARTKATTDSPVHARSRELADALEEVQAERDAALAVIEQVKARFEQPIHPYGAPDIPMVPEKVFMADAYGEDFVQDIDDILAQSPASERKQVSDDQ